MTAGRLITLALPLVAGIFIVLGRCPVVVAVDTGVASPEIVCIQCHSGLPGRYSEPVKLWKQSVHAANGIACNSCHGGDPKDAANAMSPARGFLGAPKEKDIPAFCGRCHQGVMKDYASSAHGKALTRGGPTCVTCHGNHAVVKATLDLINEKNCTRCHSFERPQMIRDALRGPDGRFTALEARIAVYKGEGGDTDRLEKALFAARNSFHAVFHELDVERVRKEAARVSGQLAKLEESLAAMDEERRWRKIAGAGAVGGALVAALLLYLMRKSLPDEQA